MCAPRARSASRCSTPNRCCSSTTTRPSSANPTRSWISAWVPTTMPASPDCASSSACRLALAPSDPVSSVTRVAMSAAPSSPRLAERPEQRAQRAGVLGGEHLGGGEHRGLPARVDRLQHRPQRHHGLARADVALHEPVHRVRPARSAAISAPTARCPAVSANGSRASNASSRPPGRGGHGRRRAVRPWPGAAARARAARPSPRPTPAGGGRRRCRSGSRARGCAAAPGRARPGSRPPAPTTAAGRRSRRASPAPAGPTARSPASRACAVAG